MSETTTVKPSVAPLPIELLIGDRISFPQIKATFGYEDRALYDVLEGVPYISVRRIRYYKPEDVRATLEKRERNSKPQTRQRRAA